MSDAQVIKRLSAKIEQLNAELAAERERADDFQFCAQTWEMAATSLHAKNIKLREALEPFAKEAERWSPAWKDRPDPNEHATPWYSYEDEEDRAPTFTIHDLRRARAVLEETK